MALTMNGGGREYRDKAANLPLKSSSGCWAPFRLSSDRVGCQDNDLDGGENNGSVEG